MALDYLSRSEIGPVNEVSAAQTIRTGGVYHGDVSGGAFTFTLDTAANLLDKGVIIVYNSATSGSNALTIDGAGSETIDGAANFTLANGKGAILWTDGTAVFSIQGA